MHHLYKIVLAAAIVAAGSVFAEEEAPHWIGLDTTARNAEQVTATTAKPVATALNTAGVQVEATPGVTVYGYKKPGITIILR